MAEIRHNYFETRFPNLDAALHAACAVSEENQGESRRVRDPDFFGTRSFEEAVVIASRGWPEGRDRAEIIRARIEARLLGEIPIPEVQYDVTGDCLDIGRLVNGEPENFMTLVDSGLRRESWCPRILKITINVSVSSYVEAETIFIRGAALLAVVDVLERHGIRCEIDIVNGVNENAFTYIRAKDAQDTLELDKLAFLFCHPSTLRRLIWSIREGFGTRERAANGITNDGYGSPCEIPAAERGEGTIYLGAINSRTRTDWSGWSEETALLWAENALREQGIAVGGLA